MNKNLEAYYDAWDKYIDAWVVIKIQDPSYVYRWRLQVCISHNKLKGFRCVSIQTRFCFFWIEQAEIAMRQAGKAGMSDEEVLIRFD